MIHYNNILTNFYPIIIRKKQLKLKGTARERQSLPLLAHLKRHTFKKGASMAYFFPGMLHIDGSGSLLKAKRISRQTQKPKVFEQLFDVAKKCFLRRGPVRLNSNKSPLLQNRRGPASLIANEYSLETFHRSNQDTCLLHNPAVFEGDWVQSGDLLADCAASSGGELSLGKNILVAYMPWEGYNFEDAILISERLVFEDVYSSIHIERYDIEIRETKFGMETITRNIPELSDNELEHLDSNGVSKLGSWIEEGDVLVGRVTPINKKIQSTYKNLLYTILQAKPESVRDSSLRAPKGMKAKVINVQIYMLETSAPKIQHLASFLDLHKKGGKKNLLNPTPSFPLMGNLSAKKTSVKLNESKAKSMQNQNLIKGLPLKKKKTLFSLLNPFCNKTTKKKSMLSNLAFCRPSFVSQVWRSSQGSFFSYILKKRPSRGNPPLLGSSNAPMHIWLFKIKRKRKEQFFKPLIQTNLGCFKNKGFTQINIVYVYLAEKRKIQVGDKMAGRHGNKGIVSQVLPRQDMPFLANGTPIDMVLNPLGVPSRMNVGQIYECLLGLAAKYLGEHYKIFPFDEIYGPEASRSFVYSKLYEARKKTGSAWLFDPNCPGKTRLFDGRTGDPFDQSVTVGYAYMLKLVHLVDDKIHARSTGPYSLVTQQPLRGRSKQGGQRLGEMEVWALEGYGAAFTLLEMLTIKSDDMTGRMTLWSNLILNRDISIGTPESFKVLVCELQALCLDIGIFRADSEGHLAEIESLTELP